MKEVLSFLNRNALVSIYTVMFLALIYGDLVATGTDHFLQLLLYIVTFLSCYFLFNTQAKRLELGNRIAQWRENIQLSKITAYASYALSGLIVLVMTNHYIDMGHVPVIKALRSEDYYEVVGIRKEIIFISTTFNRYLSLFTIRALIPFTLLLLFVRKNWMLYGLILVLSTFYSVSLMQKSFIVSALFPLLIYTVVRFKWLFTIKYVLIIASSLYFLLYVSNPQLREIEIPEEVIEEQRELAEQLEQDLEDKGKTMEVVTASERNSSFVRAIYTRVFLVPGKMVSAWFENVPKNEPYLKGEGYRFLSPIFGFDYKNYGQILYPHIYPRFAARGIQGNANAASFMYDYSNFGDFGLVLSGIFLSLIFAFVEVIFVSNLTLKISLNTFFILMLSSSALSTLMFSGGWGLMILLFLLNKDEF